ncbi:MAG: hypothetical protein QME63_07460 [Actinomycetota bacterium]|nr:hypothetical protein [Actinomycetota bacterium]
MSDFREWADSQNKKLDRIKDLLNEIIEAHEKMQLLLSEATIRSQIERGVKEIEDFLGASDC